MVKKMMISLAISNKILIKNKITIDLLKIIF